MANEIQLKYKSAITAQESAAITADADSGGVLNVITNTSAGNGGGCHAYQCFVNVTVGPVGGAATARLKYAGAYSDTTPDNFDSGSLSVEIPASATGEFPLGIIYDPDKYSYVKLAAEDYGFTASLVVVPILPEAQ